MPWSGYLFVLVHLCLFSPMVVGLPRRGFVNSHRIVFRCKGCNARLMGVIISLYCFRFGEASHPGPTQFALGTLNSSGFVGKHGIVAQLPGGSYVSAETHLTESAVQSFNKGLDLMQSGFKLVPGAAVPHRDDSVIAGVHSDIGVVSSAPIRPANHNWSAEVWHTARIQATHILHGSTWILLGAVYGFASGPPPPGNTYSRRVICEASGPRCFGGDFNLTHAGANPHVTVLEIHGVRGGPGPLARQDWTTPSGYLQKDYL